MGHLLNSGQVGNIGTNSMKLIREDVINKWDKLGFLDGLDGYAKDNVAQLFENQASYLINEQTSASDSGSFETVVFPIVRRVFSKLLANDIVSVQALNLPIGKLFYFVPQISTNKPGFDSNNGGFDAATDDPINLYDQFYEDGKGLFDASKGAKTTGGYAVTAGTLATDGSFSAFTTSIGTEGIKKLVLKLDSAALSSAGTLIGPDGKLADTESFLAGMTVAYTAGTMTCGGTNLVKTGATSNLDFRLVTQKYGQAIVDASGNLLLEVDLTCPACATCTAVNGYAGLDGNALSLYAGHFMVTLTDYATLELEDNMAEVTFKLDSVTVSVTERKLRATWSPELAQDVSAFHNIDAEAELTALLSEQVAAEIDREILKDLRNGAAWKLRWDYDGWKRANSGSGYNAYTQKDWNQTLITTVNQLSAQIHKSTLRGGANFIVCSAEASAIFDDLEYFHVSNASPEQDSYNMGIEKIGSLSGRYTVYRDPYFPAGKILIGHKGKSLLDTGYVYAPYVPLQLTPTMYNPFNFAPIKGIMTRYAKKLVNNRFYGVINIDGIRTFNINELR